MATETPEAELRLGDRATWKYAPSWWNPQGEKIYEIGDSWVRLEYGGERIPFSDVIVVSRGELWEKQKEEKCQTLTMESLAISA